MINYIPNEHTFNWFHEACKNMYAEGTVEIIFAFLVRSSAEAAKRFITESLQNTNSVI